MKEIKAYIRPTTFDPVICELENAGGRDITVIRIDAIGTTVDEETAGHQFFGKYDESTPPWPSWRSSAPTPTIRGSSESSSGARGDGRIFVSIVNEAQHSHQCARRGGALPSDFWSPKSVNRLSAAEVGNTAAVCFLQ